MTTRKHRKSPFHYMVFRRPDGSQVNVSCKTLDRTAASLMSTHAKLLLDANNGKLVPLPEILETAETICRLINKRNTAPVEAIPYLTGLLQEHTGSKVYLNIKKRVLAIFEEVLIQAGRSKIGMREVSGDDIGKFKADMIGLGLGDRAVRMYMHTLSSLFETALKREVVNENVVRQVAKPPRPENSPRRPFTDEELRKVFAVADEEWRGMIMVGLYTGLRLGDICRLVYRDIDLVSKHIRAAVKKVKGFEPKPIPDALLRYFNSLKWPADPDQPLFPRAYTLAMTGCRAVGRVSQEFIELLIRAGVRAPGERQGKGQRQGANKYAPLSFHCLRHNFTTMMKKAKVAEAVARKIGGHRSVAVSDIYTHLGEDILLEAVQNVPNIIDISAVLAARSARPKPQVHLQPFDGKPSSLPTSN